MPSIHVYLEGDGVWPDLVDKDIIHATETWHIAALKGGMASGEPSISLRIDLDDNQVLVAETSWAALRSAFHILNAKFGESTIVNGNHRGEK